MREILFRAKRTDGIWVEGYYFAKPILDYHTIQLGAEQWQVDPSTVGQYTGLCDKNGKRIFEGDILCVQSGWHRSDKPADDRFDKAVKGLTYWCVEHKIYNAEMGFFTFGIDRRWFRPLTASRLRNADAVVAGNLHDNPGLLEVHHD